MKYLFLLLLCLSGCAGIQVNVDLLLKGGQLLPMGV